MDGIDFDICIFFSQIVGSVAKGCPLLEYIDLDFGIDLEDPLCAELIALSSLRHLRSVFISVRDISRTITSKEREDLRFALDAIVEQGLLEVRLNTRNYSNKKAFKNQFLSFKLKCFFEYIYDIITFLYNKNLIAMKLFSFFQFY